jgi:hypothetical protein
MDHPEGSNRVDPQSILDLVDSMMHAPRLVQIGERHELDRITVVLRHVEIWKWRIVLSATKANRQVPAPDTVVVQPEDRPPGSKIVIAERFESKNARHESHRWLSEWSVEDNLGTAYRQVSGHGCGSGGDWWTDLAVQFQPAPPVDAGILTINGPDGVTCTVVLPASRPS